MDENTSDITAALTPEPETREKMRKVAYIGIIALGAYLLIDDQIKKLSERKKVTLTVVDKPES
jgi:hypothetical protein